MPNNTDTVVRHNEARNRFEADVAGRTAVLEYKRNGQSMVFTHTEVPPEMEGQGIASKLARAGLDYALEQKLSIVPLCPFVASYIRRHSEYQSSVAGEHRHNGAE